MAQEDAGCLLLEGGQLVEDAAAVGQQGARLTHGGDLGRDVGDVGGRFLVGRGDGDDAGPDGAQGVAQAVGGQVWAEMDHFVARALEEEGDKQRAEFVLVGGGRRRDNGAAGRAQRRGGQQADEFLAHPVAGEVFLGDGGLAVVPALADGDHNGLEDLEAHQLDGVAAEGVGEDDVGLGLIQVQQGVEQGGAQVLQRREVAAGGRGGPAWPLGQARPQPGGRLADGHAVDELVFEPIDDRHVALGVQAVAALSALGGEDAVAALPGS